jgi:molybdate transport system regulatory protein
VVHLTVRVDLGPVGAVGHGKIRLLEQIGALGSISGAARAVGMSYRNAWLLVDSLNQAFETPLVATNVGGRSGGGASLTPFGAEVIATYRAIEEGANAATRDLMEALARGARTAPPHGPAAAKARRTVGRQARRAGTP